MNNLICKIGLISDTHNLFRNQIYEVFDGCEYILHAGDIASYDTILKFQNILSSNFIAVSGNNDLGKWASEYPIDTVIDINNIKIYLIHDIDMLDYSKSNGCNIIIYGHSHKPFNKFDNGVLFMNPGSFGPRRFSNPISLATLEIIENSSVKLTYYYLDEINDKIYDTSEYNYSFNV